MLVGICNPDSTNLFIQYQNKIFQNHNRITHHSTTKIPTQIKQIHSLKQNHKTQTQPSQSQTQTLHTQKQTPHTLIKKFLDPNPAHPYPKSAPQYLKTDNPYLKTDFPTSNPANPLLTGTHPPP